jgi:hypothetical protein
MATSLDRLIRKEVSLGAIREKLPPLEHIGLAQIAPFLEVATDDAIFEYVKQGFQDGLAPARAEDAEAELSQKDETLYGLGRTAVIDWSLKDKYTASDVTRYREDMFIQQQLRGVDVGQLQLDFTGRSIDQFQNRLAREDARRRRFLDNRIEWMITQALQTGGIAYNDGKIKWTVSYGRPAGQQDQAPAGGLYNGTTHDPIGDIIALSQFMWDTYGVRPKRCITSRRVLNTFWKSDRFVARTGLVVGGTPATKIDPNYLIAGWSQDAAVEMISAATGIQFIEYNSVYRTRPIGSSTITNVKFLADDRMYFLPNDSIENTGLLGPIDDTEIGFAKTLTAPHPEGNWQAGYYEWEDETRDPWMHVRGSGIKAFPVFPYMELTYVMKVL